MAQGTVFVNNRTQAVRLPAETRFPDDVKKSASGFVAMIEFSLLWERPGIHSLMQTLRMA